MMMKWKEGLSEIKERAVRQLVDYWDSKTTGWTTTENGVNSMRKLYDRFGFAEVYEAIGIAAQKYLVFLRDGTLLESSVHDANKKIGGICFNRKNGIGAK